MQEPVSCMCFSWCSTRVSARVCVVPVVVCYKETLNPKTLNPKTLNPKEALNPKPLNPKPSGNPKPLNPKPGIKVWCL